MGRLVKITKRKMRNSIAYAMNVPKALMDLLGEPKEVILSLEVRDGKQVIIMEPVQNRSQGQEGQLEVRR